MSLVVFLKGVNVGGHRRVRPTELATQLKKYDVANIGAAGTFVVRKPISQAKLRAELKRRLPFEAEMMICRGSDILRLAATNPFAQEPADRSVMQFVTVLAQLPSRTATPIVIPPTGEWEFRVLDHIDQFVIGVCRRHMKAIGHFGQLEKIFGFSGTTRSWSTIIKIARILEEPGDQRRRLSPSQSKASRIKRS